MTDDNKKPYSDRRWTDPPGAEVISHRELTPEEEAETEIVLDEFIEKFEKAKEEYNAKK